MFALRDAEKICGGPPIVATASRQFGCRQIVQYVIAQIACLAKVLSPILGS
jgi:hypothetical protein